MSWNRKKGREGTGSSSPEEELGRLAARHQVGTFLLQGGCYLHVSSAFADIFAYPASELVGGERFSSLVHPDDLDTMSSFVSEIESGQPGEVRCTFRGVTRHGETIHLEMVGSCVTIGDRRVVTGTMRDITERVRPGDTLQLGERFFHGLMQHLPQRMFIKGRDLRYVSCNDSFAHDLGITPEDVAGKDDYEFFPRELADRYRADDLGVLQSEAPRTIEEPYRVGGEDLWVETSKVPFRDQQGRVVGVLGVFEDITRRKRAEISLMTLSECSKALVRVEEEGQWMEQVCRIVTHTGGYRMAWVGMARQDPERSVMPTASSGYEDSYLETVPLSWKDNELGREPTGTAIREERTVIAANIPTEAGSEPWRAEAVRRGYGSSIALPLRVGGRVAGALSIYSQSLNAFGPEEVRILEDLAGELGYGLEVLRARHVLQKAEAELSAIFSMSLDLICIADITTATFLKVNPAFTATLGYSEEELLNEPFFAFIHPDDLDKTTQVVENSLKKGIDAIGFENRYRCKDGSFRWLSWVSHPDPAAGVTFAVARDVTDWKQAHQQLEENKRLLDATNRLARVGGWELDAETMEVSWTEETHRIHEVPLDSKPPLEEAINFFHPDERERLEKAITAALERGEPYDLEVRFITAKGRHLWTRTKCEPVWLDGRVVKLRGLFHDVTELKSYQQRIEASEAKYRALFDQSFQGVYLHDFDGRILDANQMACTQSGYSRDELLRLSVFDLHPQGPASPNLPRELILDEWNAWGPSQRIAVEAEHQRKDGTIFPALILSGVVRYDDEDLILALVQDISERKATERALHEATAMLRTAMDCSPAGIAIAEAPSGKLRYVNQAALGIRRGTAKELMDSIGVEQYVDTWQILHFDGTPYEEDEVPLVRAVKYGETCDRQFIVRRPDQEDRVVWAHAAPVLDDTGRVSAGIVVFPDITDLKKTEQALRESEETLKKAQRVAGVGSWWFDLDSQEAKWTDEMFRIVGREPSDEPVSWGEHRTIIHPDDWEVFEANGARASITGTGYDIELRVTRPDGEIAHVRVICEPELDDSGNVVKLVGTTQDITAAKRIERQRKELEAKIQQTQKMDAVGTLASGIAHDFNNILAAILGYSELALEELHHENTGVRRTLTQINEAATKAKNLVRQILTFSRKMEGHRLPLSINRAAEESAAILARTLPKMVQLKLDLQDDLLPVEADPQQMEQVFINLATNAAHAMEGSGRIVITTTNLDLEQRRCTACGEEISGLQVLITFSDDGEGMDAEVQTKIFEPFFTTKGVGEGTGLGLSTVYGIVTGLGGHICCRSRAGEGTEFMIYLPAATQVTSERVTESTDASSKPTGSGTIIVVDDEEALRQIAQAMLTRCGYEVLLAASGEEALATYRSRPGQVDLVVMDLGMPGMGGKACLAEIRRVDPGAKVLIASGYIQYELTDQLEKLGAVGMVSKPYRMADLQRAVQEALSS